LKIAQPQFAYAAMDAAIVEFQAGNLSGKTPAAPRIIIRVGGVLFVAIADTRPLG
jgi:hypothetical protein